MSPKHILSLGVIFVALLASVLTAAASVGGDPAIIIDGSKLPSDVPAIVSGDRVLVPLRGVFEDLGAQVSFDEASGVATASLGASTVKITLGSKIARVNDQPRTMDVAAREIAGRVMVPLRFVSQALGVSVDYDEQSNSVVIVTGRRPGSFAAYAGGPVYENLARIAPTIESERPASGEIVGSQYPSIYARFNGGTSAVDPGTVEIQVDGIDVSDQATISAAYVSYTPLSPLATGLHNVYVTGQADDGTPFSESWSFRVDAGSVSDYTVGTYGGAGFGSPAFGYGWPWFRRFGFAPPGFSVFTPGQLYFISGGIIEVVFFSRFFPFGSAFFTVSGCPGEFAMTPWLGNPGFFWGYMQVPFGLRAHNAIIAAHFTMPDGRHVEVHSTAPIDIEGERHSLPASLRYAVLPHLINQPKSLHQAVVFDRVSPPAYLQTKMPANFANEPSEFRSGSINSFRLPGEPYPAFNHEPGTVRLPAVVRPELPTIRPAIIAPVFGAPVFQRQAVPAAHPSKPH
jgi:Copper amine oxidase N-terminal domain